MSARESIDIEALLFRAYGEKRVHKLPHRTARAAMLGLVPPRAGCGGGFSTAERVDTSSFSARVAGELREIQARMGAAPSGLIDLHDLVLGLENFYLETLADGGWQVWDADTAERLGHRVFDTREGASIAKVRPRTGGKPGEVVEIEARRRLTRIVTSALVVQHGQYGDRPYVPDLIVTRLRPVYAGARKEAVDRTPEYETAPHVVIEARAAYAAWHAALGLLAQVMACSREYAVTGPRAPAAPWEGPGTRIVEGAAPYDLTDRHPDDPEDADAPRKASTRTRRMKKKQAATAA